MRSSGNKDASVDRSGISASARITGQSLITGPRTRIGDGAVIENSRIEDSVVEAGARIVNSILTTRGPVPPAPPRGGFGAKWAVSGRETGVGARSVVKDSLVHNTAIGADTTCDRCALVHSTIGDSNRLEQLFATKTVTGRDVRVKGPTEAGGAWFGYGTVIDRCAFFNGVFSNDLYVFEFDAAKKAIAVRETIEIPHVARYGMNVIDSGNSGNIRDQDGGALRSLGPVVRLWHDKILLGQPVMHSPLCFVSGWTKVIGKSARIHGSANELVQDTLATCLMPFSVSGFGGDSVIGQAIVGELNNGYAYKKRVPGWIFSYAPGAVVNAVRRLLEAGVDAQLADNIVKLSLKNALALLRLYAHERNIDYEALGGTGWRGWLAEARRIYEFHLQSGLWEFKDGEPLAWKFARGKWKPRSIEPLMKVAPDAVRNQVSEEQMLGCAEKPLKKRLGPSQEELKPTLSPTRVDDEAKVAPGARLGPGVRVIGKSVVEDGVTLFRTVVRDSVIESGAELMNSVVADSRVGGQARCRFALLRSASVGRESTVDCARIRKSDIARCSTIYPFAMIENSRVANSCIVGTTVRNAEVNSFLMSYHMPGFAANLKVDPVELTHEGKRHKLMTIPMLGGGMRILGRKGKVTGVSCAFVGSNAIVEAGAYVGFGCFVLGRLTGREGLLPFTVSTGPGPGHDQIGAVASSFAHIVISHFIQWNYQANGPERARLVARMVPCMLEEGREAVRRELRRRETGAKLRGGKSFEKYRSLRLYTEDQLRAGLSAYDNELGDDRWRMEYADGELRFCGAGAWRIANGIARWERDAEANPSSTTR